MSPTNIHEDVGLIRKKTKEGRKERKRKRKEGKKEREEERKGVEA